MEKLAFTKKDDVYHGQTSAWIGETLLWVSPDDEITKLHVDKVNAAAESWAQSREEEAVEAFREKVALLECAMCREMGRPTRNNFGELVHTGYGICKAINIRSLPAGTEGKEDGHDKA